LKRRFLSVRSLYFRVIPGVILILSMLSPAGFCQHGNATDVNMTVYNVEQGLAQSTVYQISQDHRGLIWLATGNGIQCFDGSSFRAFDIPENIPFSAYGKAIHEMACEKNGGLVLSTGSLLFRFNSGEGRFKTIEKSKYQYVTLLQPLYKNRPLCWMSANRLCLIGDTRLYPVDLDFKPGNSLPEAFQALNSVQTPDKHILISGETGYLDLEPVISNDTLMRARWIPLKTRSPFLCTDTYGQVFLLSEGIIYSRAANGALQEVFRTGIRESSSLFIDRSHHFWIADKNHKKLFRISEGKLSEIRPVTHEGRHLEVLEPAVVSMFEDSRGNIWLGTDGNGLLFISPGQMMFDRAEIGFTRCMAYFDGDIWAGTFKNGLWRLSTDLRRSRPAVTGKLPRDLYYYDLVTDGPDRLWAATSQGIYIFNARGAIIFHYPLKTESATFLTLPGNNLLLSTYGDLYSCETGDHPRVSFIREQTQIKDLLAYHGFCWIGNHFGLFRKDLSPGWLPAIYFYAKDGISTAPVYCIMVVDSTIWVGSENGIACFTPDGKKTSVPPCMEEMKHEIVYSLVRDAQNRIWFAGNKGIGCVAPERDRIIRFSDRNNLQSSEFNSNANLSIPGGRIYFGGINGINGIDPSKLVINIPPPDIRLISLFISDSTFSAGIPSEGTTVNINWDAPYLEGTVFTPAYFPSGTAKYSFFLEGYQHQWSQPSSYATFSYRNLPPGEYTLWGRCIDPLKNPGKERCLVKIMIRPPFWKTWTFLSLLSLLLVLALALAIKKIQEAKNRNLIKALEQRNAIDRERLRISRDMHDEIGASLTQISILSEIVKKQQGDPDKMMKSIEQISGISGTVVDDMSEIIWAMNPKNDNLASFMAYLRQHTSEYLMSAGIDGCFHFPEECPPVSMTSEQNRNIYLVVKEAIHNAVKHSEARSVNVSLSYSDAFLSISIEDNGKGFVPEKPDRYGNGLTTMRKRIENLGGSYVMDSAPGKGTRVNFSVSLTRKNSMKG